MKISTALTALIPLITLFSHTACAEKQSCQQVICPAGTKAVTYASKSEMYYACPTRELSEYTAAVLGILSMQASFGSMPNVSPETGEPEQKGETKLMLDNLRNAANVSTYDQAISMCEKGGNKIKVTVMNNSEDTTSIWVMMQNQKKSFWLPKSFLDKN